MTALPWRRPCVTYDVQYENERYHLAVGVNPLTGDVCEVWAYGPKVGSALWCILQDMCVDISHQLQDDTTPEDFAARAVRHETGEPVSLVGIIADLMCRSFDDLPRNDP